MSSSLSEDALASRQKAVTDLYDAVWAKVWTRQKRTLLKAEITTPVDWEGGDNIGGWWGAHDDVDGLEKFEYEAIGGVDKVARALWLPSRTSDVLVVRREYESLIESLTTGGLRWEDEPVIVIGHPGIGKTMFILYLLLHRLERKQPTAIQVAPNCYFIFDDKGAAVRPVHCPDERLSKCWALTDSDANLTRPCDDFMGGALRIVQATTLEPEQWDGWKRQKKASLFVMDFPCYMEIGAIGKELGFDPSLTLLYANKWGPCIRTVVNIVDALGKNRDIQSIEYDLEMSALGAAEKMLKHPWLIRAFISLIPGVGQAARKTLGSSLIFLCPYRAPDSGEGFTIDRTKAVPCIPTKHLVDIMEEKRSGTSDLSYIEVAMSFRKAPFF